MGGKIGNWVHSTSQSKSFVQNKWASPCFVWGIQKQRIKWNLIPRKVQNPYCFALKRLRFWVTTRVCFGLGKRFLSNVCLNWNWSLIMGFAVLLLLCSLVCDLCGVSFSLLWLWLQVKCVLRIFKVRLGEAWFWLDRASVSVVGKWPFFFLFFLNNGHFYFKF